MFGVTSYNGTVSHQGLNVYLSKHDAPIDTGSSEIKREQNWGTLLPNSEGCEQLCQQFGHESLPNS